MTPKELGKLSRDRTRRNEFIAAVPYMNWYEGIDFRQHPEKYRIGRGEQGVLMAEPYKSKIVKNWRFRTPDIATQSSRTIYAMFEAYLAEGDFPGADMARKFLQMGWTRARRYANHPSGVKYDDDRNVRPLAPDHQTSLKAESARIFKAVYDVARAHPEYLRLKTAHQRSVTHPRTVTKLVVQNSGSG